MWHIFSFDIHVRWPAIQKLDFHLFDNQVVCFGDWERTDYVLARNYEKRLCFLLG